MTKNTLIYLKYMCYQMYNKRKGGKIQTKMEKSYKCIFFKY